LIGFRNRLMVMIQWGWSYLTYERGARLITGSDELPGWIESQQPGSQRQPEADGPAEPSVRVSGSHS
jgi:NADH dehydrogenase